MAQNLRPMTAALFCVLSMFSVVNQSDRLYPARAWRTRWVQIWMVTSL